MTNPRVDIIIPCYNTAKYLAQAIDSALEQTYPDSSVLVVDDGSTDSTREVVESYGRRVGYLYQENQGLPGARNAGICHTDGEYVCFLDADDIILPSSTADQVSFLQNHPEVDIVHGKTLRVFGNNLDHSYVEDWRPYARWEDYLIPLSMLCPFSVHSALVRRRVFSRHGLFPSEMITGCEDWAFWLKYTLEGGTIGYLPMVSGFYRQHGSAMCSGPERIAQQESALIRTAVDMFRHHGISDERRLQILSCGIRFIALKWLSLGRPEEFLELVALARTVSPDGVDERCVDVFSRVDPYPLHYLFLAKELYDLEVPQLAISCLVQAGDIRTVRQAAVRHACIPFFDETIELLKRETRALMEEECRISDAHSSTNQSGVSLYAKLEQELPRQVSFYAHAFFQFSLLSEHLGRTETAIEEVEEAVSHNLNFRYARLHWAKLLLKTRSYRLAARELEEACLIDPGAVSRYLTGAFETIAPNAVAKLLPERERMDWVLRRVFHVVPLFVKFTRSVASGVKKMMNR